MKKLNKLFAILIAVLGVTTLKAQTEIISNGNNLNKQHNFGSVSSHTIPELWCDDARQGFNFSQAVELPNGVYTLSFQMMYRASLTAGTSTNCALYAETSGEVYNEPIKNFADVAGTNESLTGVTDAMNNSADNYKSTIPYFIVTDGRSTVGARSLGALTRCTNGYWLIWNPASFKLVSVTDNATLTQALNDLKAEAKAILDAAPDSDAKATLQAAYNNAVATSDGLVALKQAIKAYLPGTGTAANPVDVSSLILSADFSQKAFIVATKNNNSTVSLPELQPVGWTCTDTGNGQYNFFNVVANNATYDNQSNFAYNGKTTGQSLYMRHAWGTADLVAKQTVKLPNGRYKISVPAKKTANTATVKYTFAGTTETHNVTTSWAVYEKTFTVNDANNELTIELTYSHPSGGGQRAFFDGVTLLCYGDPIKALLEEISTKTDELREYKTQIPQNAYASYNEHLTAAGNVNNSMEESALQTILDNLNADIAAAESLVSPYVNLKSLITTCERYLDNSIEFEDGAAETFSTAVGSAKTNVESATTADGINNIYNTLEAVRQTYVQQADPLNGIAFDYTFKVTNPGFDNGKTGWESTGGAQNKAIATNKANGIITGTFFENWNGSNFTGEIYQTISNLPSGIYKLKVAAYGAGTNVYANDKQTAVTTSDGAWYEVDQVKVGDGTLKFGIKNENATNWMGIDNASIYYYGFDVATAQASVSELKAKAEAIVTEAKPMNADIATALNAAIADADATKDTRKELSPMIDALSSAVADAEASIADYEKIAQYIDKADNIDASIAAGYKSQYENGSIAETTTNVFQNLEVATYDYVTENFKYAVHLSSTWNSTGTNTSAKEFNNEHWSGETRGYMNQNDDNGQGWNASAWSLDFDQDVTLPAGEYVFKVAGRKSADATLELVVTMGETILGTVEDFPNGSTGLGINKAGEASFDPNDAFTRNENTGFGWQWRYVRFVLDAEATVKVAVHAEANSHGQWVSFGDYTLQMTEETYLAANMHGLDAPTAAANALVDTKPMGTAENNDLRTALDMPVTTGAELQAKITALEAAVANANAWIPLYNEAKVPLVAALERFEADYNDAQNGALNHMNVNRWATAISMAQAAAVAKDATDSYDGFEKATNNLVAALDAATTSIDEYAALNEAIMQAETLASANVGDQPFQRSADAINGLGIADAQATYTAATADSEKVTSVTETLKAAINGIVLNAPAEGQRFHMVLTNNGGWEHDGKAVTYLAGGRNDAGLYNIQYYAAPNANYAQAFTFTAVEGQPDCYNLSMTDVDGNERYVSTGTVYGGNANQIRTTTDASQALAVKVIATATEGVWNLYNTEANQYIGGQDAGFYTVNSHINFNIVEAVKAEVTLSISDARWATLILPFNAELPEGVKAYSCGGADGETLTLEEATSIKANTPYLMNGEAGKHEFAGYGLADKDSYPVGLFTGTYVEYQTTTNGYTYVLQKNNNVVAFYLVGEEAQPLVKAYRCYMTYEGAAGAPMFSISRGEDTTGIENSTLNAPSTVIYDLMGRKVTTMVKGGMYIVNGRKVVVK